MQRCADRSAYDVSYRDSNSWSAQSCIFACDLVFLFFKRGLVFYHFISHWEDTALAPSFKFFSHFFSLCILGLWLSCFTLELTLTIKVVWKTKTGSQYVELLWAPNPAATDQNVFPSSFLCKLQHFAFWSIDLPNLITDHRIVSVP